MGGVRNLFKGATFSLGNLGPHAKFQHYTKQLEVLIQEDMLSSPLNIFHI